MVSVEVKKYIIQKFLSENGGLTDSYIFFGKPAVGLKVDYKNERWVCFVGEIVKDNLFESPVIKPNQKLVMSLEEGVGAVKLLKAMKRPYTFEFLVEEEV